MTKNLLIITQKADENDDLLGFFVSWIKEFSSHFNKVFVITLEKGNYDLPQNVFVYSVGKEKNSLRFFRFLKFYFFLFKLVPQSSGLFAHMSPIFALASWPIALLFGRKIFLWYLHRSLTFRLKVAEKVCFKIFTADKDSLTIKSKKIVESGHGIDVGRFRVERSWQNEAEFLKILSVGRISKIKNYTTLIKAAKILKDRGLMFKISIIGRPVMPYDFEYFEELKRLVERLKLENFIEFVGFVPYSRIAPYYKESDIFINLAPTGGIDKVVLEAMASGLLVLVSNLAFEKYLGPYADKLIFEQSDLQSLAEKLLAVNSFPSLKKQEISQFLFNSVNRSHNLTVLIDKISLLILHK